MCAQHEDAVSAACILRSNKSLRTFCRPAVFKDSQVGRLEWLGQFRYHLQKDAGDPPGAGAGVRWFHTLCIFLMAGWSYSFI